ncbi:MAG: hypothetical protein IT353_10625 [Gemmatimonadaceae bacterium]|nr:hypothetical protein [Gemmatimonadaceae bacterium]
MRDHFSAAETIDRITTSLATMPRNCARFLSLRLLTLLSLSAAAGHAQAAPNTIDRSSAEGWRRSIALLEPSTPDAWRAAAVRDVDGVSAALLSQSPIGITPASRPIQRVMDAGLRVARLRAAKVRDRAGYYATLSTLSLNLGDPHAAVYFQRNYGIGLAIPEVWWAGFRVRMMRDSATVFYVADADSAQWHVGDVIVDCGGISLDSLVSLNVLPFRAAETAAQARTRRAVIPQLFMDQENSFIQRPASCRRRGRDGIEQVLSLNWRARTDAEARAISAASSSQVVTATPNATTTLPSFGLTWVTPTIAWIRLPSFNGDSATTARITALASIMRAQSTALRAAQRIVLDVRGNSGGSSFNGDRVVDAIWTADESRQFGAQLETLQIGWRATQENLAYWRNWTREQERQLPDTATDVVFGRSVIRGLTGALARKQPLWIETSRGINPSVNRGPARPSVIGATVMLLSDGACFSACLDFADRVLAMPGTRLIGADTDGDGLLMEIRTIPLPSGLTSVAIPQKIALNRKRGHRERYRVDLPYTGPWSDDALKVWVAGLAVPD